MNQVDIKIGMKGIELQNPVGKAIATGIDANEVNEMAKDATNIFPYIRNVLNGYVLLNPIHIDVKQVSLKALTITPGNDALTIGADMILTF